MGAARTAVMLPELHAVLLLLGRAWIPGGHDFCFLTRNKHPVSALTGTQCLELGWVFCFLPGAEFLCPSADSKDKGSAPLSG